MVIIDDWQNNKSVIIKIKEQELMITRQYYPSPPYVVSIQKKYWPSTITVIHGYSQPWKTPSFAMVVNNNEKYGD